MRQPRRRLTLAAGTTAAALLACIAPALPASGGSDDPGTTSTGTPPRAVRIESFTGFPGGLIGVSSTEPGVVYSISQSDGAATALVTMNGDASLTGASFLGGQLYATDLLNYPGHVSSTIGSIATDGTITFLSSQGGSINWHGLASDEGQQVMYSMDTSLGVLQVQHLDGTVVSVGPGTGIDGRGMAYADELGVLYATNNSDMSLYSVDVTTGLATLIGSMGIPVVHSGLAYDEETQTLYYMSTNVLYTLDVATAAPTLVGATGLLVTIDGLAWRTPRIFSDGFESGNTSAWSASVP